MPILIGEAGGVKKGDESLKYAAFSSPSPREGAPIIPRATKRLR